MALYQNRIVVKAGTSTIMNETGKTDLRNIDLLVRTLSDLQNSGYQVILVTSGAIAVGANKLNMKGKPQQLRLKQAAAAVGQCSLLYLYDKFFGDYDKTIAQVLLSEEDTVNEEGRENLQNTFDSLLDLNVIPIVNENDATSAAEIESKDRLFGDNDYLSAIVSVLTKAGTLAVLAPEKDLRRGKDAVRTLERTEALAKENGIRTLLINEKDPGSLITLLKKTDLK